MKPDTMVLVPWHNPKQVAAFKENWRVAGDEPFLILQQDQHRAGCAETKNAAVAEAVRRGAGVVVVLDDDCYPSSEAPTLQQLCEKHEAALEPQPVAMYNRVSRPASRGTPYFHRSLKMPVAASMGFWLGVPDYDAPSQLVHGTRTTMEFFRGTQFGRYFPLSGMNLAFRPADWLPWCTFVDVPRFDDIFMGYLWQREAYRRGCCFNLDGPLVTHSRQSDVFANLRQEAEWLEANETLWQSVHLSKETDYERLRVGLLSK